MANTYLCLAFGFLAMFLLTGFLADDLEATFTGDFFPILACFEVTDLPRFTNTLVEDFPSLLGFAGTM